MAFSPIFDKNRIFSFSRVRIVFLLLFVGLFFLTELGRRVYRPYIYSNHIFDYWIADTIGNLTGTMTIIFMELGLMNQTKKKSGYMIIFITAGLIVYELLQYYSPRSRCDWRDIVATVVAGFLSWLICAYTFSQVKEDDTGKN